MQVTSAILIVVVATLAAAAGWCAGPGDAPGAAASPSSAPETGELEVADDGTAVATGVVEENRRDCEVDGLCVLVLAVGELRLKVVYVEGEADPCPNRVAGDAGYAAEPGDRLQVHGAYRPTPGGGVVSTCPDSSYYIRPAADPVSTR